ncbi:MAG: 5-formyltetrahydrofolate cyclo-ligase [Lachnospiraceae bacterium]|nr:5-formyltetrahydrofolate cyclo-ligase [Lachnospiraceae bacterium]
METNHRISQTNQKNKKEVRRQALLLRDALSPEERSLRSRQIMDKVLALPCYREARVILAYASFRSEVDTLPLVGQALQDGKRVFMPRVAGKEMEFWQIDRMEDLRRGYQGIPEPAESLAYPAYCAAGAAEITRAASKTLMWMPGAAFDRERHRIGYGGGFYDKYLYRLGQMRETDLWRDVLPALTTMALAFDCQVSERIPSQPHDYRPDMIVTEQCVIRNEI